MQGKTLGICVKYPSVAKVLTLAYLSYEFYTVYLFKIHNAEKKQQHVLVCLCGQTSRIEAILISQ